MLLHSFFKKSEFVFSKTYYFFNVCQFLSCKEVVYVLNTSPHEYLRSRSPWLPQLMQEITSSPRYGHPVPSRVVLMSLSYEQSLVSMKATAGALEEYLLSNSSSHGSAINKLVGECFRAVGAIKFYTRNEQEVRCWVIRYGKTLSEASALLSTEIHRFVLLIYSFIIVIILFII
jgi:ribosome-binding ATPase YchF (GTP1/OBG family)